MQPINNKIYTTSRYRKLFCHVQML